MFGHIILLDLPEGDVQLDLAIYQVDEDFFGFAQVAAGVHYLAVAEYEGEWVTVVEGGVVVYQFDLKQKRLVETEEEESFLAKLQEGELNQHLIGLMGKEPRINIMWQILVNQLTEERYFVLHDEDLGQGSAFEKAFWGTHYGDEHSFVAELQYSFVSWVLGQENEQGEERWQYLLAAVFGAEIERMIRSKEMFVTLVDLFLLQFSLLDEEWFVGLTAIDPFIKNLVESDELLLIEKGEELNHFIAGKQ